MADLYPCGRRPRPCELFSSWDTGTALNHGMNLNALNEQLLADCYFRLRDIDKYADSSIVSRLAAVTDTNLEDALKTSLYLRALPISTLDRNVNTARWITRVNNIYTTRRAYGLCFCPLCLQEDKEPYFRVDWRLSFVTMCVKHNCLLQHRCPWCKKEVNLYRIPAGSANLSICCWCGQDISKAPVLQSNCFTQYSKIQMYLIDILNKAHVEGGYGYKKIREYFLTLYSYCYTISMRHYEIGKGCVSIYQELSELLKKNETHFQYDAYEPIVRLIVLRLAFCLFEKNESCNFKIHSQLYAANNGERRSLLKDTPCGQWCSEHDYLGISKSCKRFIAEAMT